MRSLSAINGLPESKEVASSLSLLSMRASRMPRRSSPSKQQVFKRISKAGERLPWQEWDFRWINTADEEYLVALYEYGREAIRLAVGKADPIAASRIKALVSRKVVCGLDLGFWFTPPDSWSSRLLQCLELIGLFRGQSDTGAVPACSWELRDNIRAYLQSVKKNSSLGIRLKSHEATTNEDPWAPATFEFTPPVLPRLTIDEAVKQFTAWARASGEFTDAIASLGGKQRVSPLLDLSYYRFTMGCRRLKVSGEFQDALKDEGVPDAGQGRLGRQLFSKDVDLARKHPGVAWSNGINRVDGLVSLLADELIRLVSHNAVRRKGRPKGKIK